ncbi:MAG: cell division protein PerM [Haloechinothrix sp.]
MSPAVDRVRVLLAAAAWPLLAGYAAIAALLAVVNALAAPARFSASGVLLAAAPGWLAAHQVPLTIDGQQLGLLPLVLTIAAGALVARSAGDVAGRLGYAEPRQAIPVIGTIAGMYGVVGATIAIAANGSSVTAQPPVAFGLPALLSGLSATAGLARRCGLLDLARPYIDDVAVIGLRAAWLGMAGLLAVGALVLTLSSVLSAPTMHGLFAANAPGFGSGFGMLLLSLAYLPNAVLCALAFATGPGFSFGSVSVSPFGFTGGAVPGVPLLAGIPDGHAGWWLLLLVLPACVGALVGWTYRRADPVPLVRLRVLGVAGALIGFTCVVLGTFAGGQLGSGPFGGVVIPVGLFSLAAFCWIAIPGGLVAWFAGPQPAQQAAAQEAEAAAQEAEAAADDPDERDDTEADDTRSADDPDVAGSEDTADDTSGAAAERPEPAAEEH